MAFCPLDATETATPVAASETWWMAVVSTAAPSVFISHPERTAPTWLTMTTDAEAPAATACPTLPTGNRARPPWTASPGEDVTESRGHIDPTNDAILHGLVCATWFGGPWSAAPQLNCRPRTAERRSTASAPFRSSYHTPRLHRNPSCVSPPEIPLTAPSTTL
jgi:hypothetical protein